MANERKGSKDSGKGGQRGSQDSGGQKRGSKDSGSGQAQAQEKRGSKDSGSGQAQEKRGSKDSGSGQAQAQEKRGSKDSGSSKRGSVDPGTEKRGSQDPGQVKRSSQDSGSGSEKRGSKDNGNDRRGSKGKGETNFDPILHPPNSLYEGEPEEENLTEFGPENHEPEIKRMFQYIDAQKNRYISTLREAVGIRSVSAWPEARAEVIRMVQWTGDKLRSLGCEVELRKIGDQTPQDPPALPLPPVIFAKLGNDPAKRTVLIYGHLDVQPAKEEDGWESDPFLLTECRGYLIGRGASDNKGPLLGWLHALEAYAQANVELPINIKFILESMDECGSEGLATLLKQQKDLFLADVSFVCLSDNYWLGKRKACLTYGLRGLCYFFAEVECGTKDLHSGVFGGSVIEAMPDLIYILDQLVDSEGQIMIPGLNADVCQLTEAEKELYEKIDFNLDEFKDDMGALELRFPGDKVKTLMHRWRFPALSIHGIQGCFHSPGAMTVIPRKVIGKFSIRLVPNQTPEDVDKLVTEYLAEKWEERRSPNKFKIYMADDGVAPWTANPLHPHYKAARRAIAKTYGHWPDMIREGGFMGSVIKLQEVTGKNIVIMPMGACDDAAHWKNEKIDTRNYIEGTKAFAAYLWELGKVREI